MVGVPGKWSRGCANCKRRKIGCDLQRPECGQCIRTSRKCEGYPQYSTFINYAAGGAEQDSVGGSSSAAEASLAFNDASDLERKEIYLTPESSKENQFSHYDPAQHTSPRKSRTPKTPKPPKARKIPQQSSTDSFERLPTQIDLTSVISKKIQSLYLESYLPREQDMAAVSLDDWLSHSLNHSKSSSALGLSLRALCNSRVGRIHGDENMIMRGRTEYILALKELQRALRKQKEREADETLGAVFTLSQFEIHESTSNAIIGHDSHIRGAVQLILMRGPDPDMSQFSKAIIDRIRCAAMVIGFQDERCSEFGNPEWLAWTEACGAGNRYFESRLYDLGFELHRIVNEGRSHSQEESSPHDEAISLCLEKCLALDRKLQKWFRTMEDRVGGPLYWNAVSQDDSHKTALTFRSIRTAHALMYFWALTLILRNMYHDLLEKQHSLAESSEPSDELSDEEISQYQDSIDQSCAGRFDIATTIIRGVPYCTMPDKGFYGPSRCMFALRVAQKTLERLDVDPKEVERCKAWFEFLHAECGLSFAGDVKKFRANGRFVDRPPEEDVDAKAGG